MRDAKRGGVKLGEGAAIVGLGDGCYDPAPLPPSPLLVVVTGVRNSDDRAG